MTDSPVLEGNISFSYSDSGASPLFPVVADSQTSKGGLASLMGLQFKEDGLDAVFLKPSTHLNWAMNQMDALYLKADFSQVVILKAGVTPIIFTNEKNTSKKVEMMNRLIKIGGGFLYHGKTPGGLGYALFFKGFSEQKTRAMIKKMTTMLARSSLLFPHNSHHAQRFHLPSLISLAYAEDCNKSFWEGINSTRGINDALQNISAHPTAQFAVGCLLGAFKGAWNSTGGVVVDAAHLAKETSSEVIKAMNDPQGSAKKLWQNAEKTVDAMRAFFKDFSSLAKEIYPGLMSMDSKIVGDLLCETASTVGTASLLVYLTAGAGSSISVSAIAQSLSKLENSDKFRTTLKAAKVSAASGKPAVCTPAKPSESAPLYSTYQRGNSAPVQAPEVKAPEVKAPEVKAPEVKAAEVKAPEVKAADVKTSPVSQVNELDLLTIKLSQPSLDLTLQDIENLKKWTAVQANVSTFSSSEDKQRFQSFAEALKKAQDAYRRNAYPVSPNSPSGQGSELLDSILGVPRSYTPQVNTPVRKTRNPKAVDAYSAWQ